MTVVLYGNLNEDLTQKRIPQRCTRQPQLDINNNKIYGLCMSHALKRRKTAGKRSKLRFHGKILSASGFSSSKPPVVKPRDFHIRNKGITILVDDAMLQRDLQPSPVEGTRSRSVYRQAAKKVLTSRNVKVVRAA